MSPGKLICKSYGHMLPERQIMSWSSYPAVSDATRSCKKLALWRANRIYVKMSMLVMLVKLCVQLNHTSHSNTIFTIATGTCEYEKNHEQDTMCSHIGPFFAVFFSCWLRQLETSSVWPCLVCVEWGEAFTWIYSDFHTWRKPIIKAQTFSSSVF